MSNNQDIVNLKKNRLIAIISFISLIGIILVASLSGLFSEEDQGITELPIYGVAPDFTLPSVDGTNYTFSSDAGKIRLVSFIYTKCQAGCSVITSKFAALYKRLLDKNLLNSVKFVTIDFDYQFDTMGDLQNYSKIFVNSTEHWQFLLGNKNQTDKVAKDWNFFFELKNMTTDMNMTMNTNMTTSDETSTNEPTEHEGHEVVYIHQFIVYIIDQNGDRRELILGLDWQIDDALEVIEFLINENKQNQ